jgi:predicted  nucleic acid-binding Zn-ribbon protein
METIADHPVIKVLQAEIVRLRKRVESLESHLREEHEKIERLEHEHEHDHEAIERLEHHSPTSYYTGRRTVPLGL